MDACIRLLTATCMFSEVALYVYFDKHGLDGSSLHTWDVEDFGSFIYRSIVLFRLLYFFVQSILARVHRHEFNMVITSMLWEWASVIANFFLYYGYITLHPQYLEDYDWAL